MFKRGIITMKYFGRLVISLAFVIFVYLIFNLVILNIGTIGNLIKFCLLQNKTKNVT